MVGVPSSLGCSGCRRAKKKCDGKGPPCTRCARLDMPCLGLGQKKWKFQEENMRFPVDSSASSSTRPSRSPPNLRSNAGDDLRSHTQSPDALGSIPRNLSNDTTHLTLSTLSIVDPGPNCTVAYHMPWSWGPFLEDIPARLGHNEALDTATDAVVIAYQQLCRGHRTGSGSVVKYHRALLALQKNLSNSETAYTSETLASILLLLIYETLAGQMSETSWMSHSGGAAEILKARGQTAPRTPFEARILVSIRGPVILQTLFSDRVHFTDDEWATLVNVHADPDSLEARCFTCLARVPRLYHAARRLKHAASPDPAAIATLELDIAALQAHFKPLMKPLKAQVTRAIPNSFAHFGHVRTYGNALAVGVLICQLTMAAMPHQAAAVEVDNFFYASESLWLAEAVQAYRPIGTLFMNFTLKLAWLAARRDPDLCDTVREYMEQFTGDFYGEKAATDSGDLEWIEKYFSLQV